MASDVSGKWASERDRGGLVIYEARNAGRGLSGYGDALWADSRQDVSDLIALLERVRERLPP